MNSVYTYRSDVRREIQRDTTAWLAAASSSHSARRMRRALFL